MKKLVLQLALLSALPTIGFAEAPTTAPTTKPAQTIEVCFVLDTTGSMGGLIDGAKVKIWSIANDILHSAEPRPVVKIALVAYRDRGDEYITKVFDLTDDIDTVYKNLQSFSAGGGGDGPESVNQALDESVTKIGWSTSKDVSKLVFLVGDAPPHMDYPNDVKYQQVCEAAVKKDLIVNTVQCGADSTATVIWQEIAKLGEGSYVALPQSGGMVAIATPYDKDLAELNAKINQTVVAYGGGAQRLAVAEKVSASSSAPAAAMSDRLAYNAAMTKTVQGRGDLIDDLADKSIKLEDVKDEDLPAELKGKSREDQDKILATKAEERAKVRTEIESIVKQRQDFIDAEKARLEKETGKKDSFDAQIAEMVKEQVNRK